MSNNTETFWKKFRLFFASWIIPICASGLLRAIGIYIFVSPNNFAPGGINGIAVMLEYLTKLSSGYFLIALNIPIFFVAFFFLGKKQAVASTLSMLLTSGLLIVIPWIPNFPIYGGDDIIGHKLLGAVAGGIFLGAALAIMIKSCGTSGGTTVLATLVNRKYRNISVSYLTSAFDACVVLASVFVYNSGNGFTTVLDPVLLALVSLFVTSKMCDIILQGFQVAYKVEIVTNDPEEIAKEIMEKTHHGVTRVPAVGMYSHSEHSLLICIIRKRQVAELQKIIKKYPDTFANFSLTTEVYGRFAK